MNAPRSDTGKLGVDLDFELRWKPQPADEVATCVVCGEAFPLDGHEIERWGRRALCLPCTFQRRRTEYGRDPGDVNPFGGSDRLAYGPIGAAFHQACAALGHFKDAIRHAKATR